MMDSINDALAAVLQTFRTPGDFDATGFCSMHVPLIEVDGAGPTPWRSALRCRGCQWHRLSGQAAAPWPGPQGCGRAHTLQRTVCALRPTGPMARQ
jgi:hypothetical protein